MRLLVVEDEPDLRRVVVQALVEEGFAVDSAADGETGLSKALAWEYDAIVLDLMLPVKNGWEVLKALRETNSRADSDGSRRGPRSRAWAQCGCG